MSAASPPISLRSLPRSQGVQVAAGVVAVDAIAVASLIAAHAGLRAVGIVGVGVLLVPAAVYIAAFIRPAYLISVALFLAMFSGNWRTLGLPNLVSPDRFFFIAGIAAVLLRDPATGERAPLRLTSTHLVLAASTAYVIASAIAFHDLFARADLYPLLDHFVVPFVTFAVAPVAFATERDRRFLLATLVFIAAYLAFIATAQGIGLNFLVWPRYIAHSSALTSVSPGANTGLSTAVTGGVQVAQVGRARGPFTDAALNGMALYVGAVACGVALFTWRSHWWRLVAVVIGFVCLFDLLFTLERSIWIAAVAATVIMMLAVPRLRRYLPVILLIGIVTVAGALAGSSSLRAQVTNRVQDTYSVWDRLNLDTAAEQMFLAKPLTGFGWGQFASQADNYFRLSPSYPITGVGEPVHNVYLSMLAELGLIGTLLWGLGLLMGVGGSILRRGPPELVPWRVGLVGVTVSWLVLATFSPVIQGFPTEVLWLWAGVVAGSGYGLNPRLPRDDLQRGAAS